ncbi:hypothetical protein H7200_01645 [Candidatus Saccharibacteria bacterium]|nr:hypothetical protein [Candidatus Saccharibacteria bacterium]
MSEVISTVEQLSDSEVNAKFNDIVDHIEGVVSEEIILITTSEVFNKPAGTSDQGYRED